MPFDALVFDLDGTLLDTLADIAMATNTVLTRYGWPAHPEENYRRFVGNGFAKLLSRALPKDVRASLDDDVFNALVDEGKAVYSASLLTRTMPYKGIPEALARLKSMGVAMAVVSNKPDPQTRTLVKHFFGDTVTLAHGARKGVPLKPDPAAVLEVLADMGVATDKACYVGDSDVDMITGRRAGTGVAGVAWGFRGAAEVSGAGAMWLVQSPDELPELAAGSLSPLS